MIQNQSKYDNLSPTALKKEDSGMAGGRRRSKCISDMKELEKPSQFNDDVLVPLN